VAKDLGVAKKNLMVTHGYEDYYRITVWGKKNSKYSAIASNSSLNAPDLA